MKKMLLKQKESNVFSPAESDIGIDRGEYKERKMHEVFEILEPHIDVLKHYIVWSGTYIELWLHKYLYWMIVDWWHYVGDIR